MHSVLSRPQISGGPSTGTSHHTPRRSSSFMSLRREKDKPPPPLEAFSTAVGPSGSSHGTYFDAYPRPKTTANTRSSKPKLRRTSPSTRGSQLDYPPRYDQWEKPTSRKAYAEPSYTFPSFDSTEDLTTPATPKPYSRTRSRTGPSGKSNWEETSLVPQLRFSGSSSTQCTETPPHTPVDINSSRELFEPFPAVVAAPVSGVETMDALVDGMNGGDDILSGEMNISNRARFGIHGHHPLYQPPLPTPPPGVVLGGGKLRRSKPAIVSHPSSDSNDGDEENLTHPSRPRLRRPRPTTPRASANSSTTPQQSVRPLLMLEPGLPPHSSNVPLVSNKRKSAIPSISEIIRTHAPPEVLARSRPSTAQSSHLYGHNQNHAMTHEGAESEPEPLRHEEEAEMVSRSSIDSVADEIQRTLRNQAVIKPPPMAPPSSFLKRHSTISDNISLYSPRSDPGVGTSIYSSSISSHYPPSPLDTPSFVSLIKPPSPSQEVAQYLRSKRLTTLLKLTRSPHASQDNPLNVSLSDLGSKTGHPVVVFLGLGCVRHIMGLYDEMAECLNLRLITVDRWGLGRTDPRPKSAKGIMEWASVIEEVLELLQIENCSVMAHSAGAPYALSFANKLPSRIRGDICLLAPWVGGTESSGYKWLKYVPNGILKTAQAAEWKIQAWMIGKPPTIAFEGIGYNAQVPAKSQSERQETPSHSNGNLNILSTSIVEGRPRPSIGSSSFSEYDDLGDFEGRFSSRSTLGAPGTRPSPESHIHEGKIFVTKRKTSRGLLDLLKGSSHSNQPSLDEKHQGGKRLKALRSMGSLKGRSISSKKSAPSSTQLPPSLRVEVGSSFNDLNWPNSDSQSSIHELNPFSVTPPRFSSSGPYARSNGRRSISFTSPGVALSLPSSPLQSTTNSSFNTGIGPGSAYQAALGNALLAASHSESARGTHNDLLQILNHENHSWGFSYTSYPHSVKIWYGDHDEKIAENAVRWMEHTMGEEKCTVKVVKGADHGLMYRSSVVVEVLEQILAFWKPMQ